MQSHSAHSHFLAHPLHHVPLAVRWPDLSELAKGIPLDPLPPAAGDLDPSVPHAPKRRPELSSAERRLALENALRYFPARLHGLLAGEFARELDAHGHIYMHRFRPRHYEMRAYPLDAYPARTAAGAALMLMVMNNLDARVAQYPHELITYGGNGAVLQNWAQYHVLMAALAALSEHSTLHLYSGHTLGRFPSAPHAPRCVITNGLVVPSAATRAHYERLYALGVSQYGQMTAGSFCYIGPQGIVHGTTLTVLGAARKYLGTGELRGRVFVTSGLGGMSGAQAKAAVIAGAVGVVAEVDAAALQKRLAQGWVMRASASLDEVLALVRDARRQRQPLSVAYHGNVVALWERLAAEPEALVELGSDQTSLHNPFGGGYYPVQLSFEEARSVMVADPERFKTLVQESLRRHVAAINKLTARGGFHFWDYGNSFLLEASRAGAEVMQVGSQTEFRYPSYVEHIMGDIFSLGFGPFRWVCTSGEEADLDETDRIATHVTEALSRKADFAPRKQQYEDNLLWIQHAKAHQLVVGSQARILYSDAEGRVAIAEAFNTAIKEGKLKRPVVLSRDHHDVSGTDSPYRETSNIRDGSKWCADMATHNFVGDSFRGATWVALHHGGGTGWGEAINGGFGLLLDGSEDATHRAREMLYWDVNNGVARRAWDRNENAIHTIQDAMQKNSHLHVTIPNLVDPTVLDKI